MLTKRKFFDKWVESPSAFIQHHVFFDMFWCSFSQTRERLVIGAMSKRGQDTTSSDGSPMAKARPTNLVLQGQCKEGVSSQESGPPVNPGNEYNKKRVCLASGNWSSSSSNAEVGSSQVYRQEMVNLAARRLGKKDLTRPKSEEDSPSTNLWQYHQKWKTWNSPVIHTSEKKFQCIQKKLGRTSINATCSVDSYNNCVLTWRMFMTSSINCSHPPWARFLGEFASLQEYKIREHRECVQHHSKIHEIAFWRDSECEDPGLSFTLMDKINTVQRQRDQVGEGQSLCLRRFSSMCWSDRTSTRSRRCKMDRTNWRSQKVFLEPRRIWSWWRSNWIRVENFPGFTTLTFLKDIQMDLERKNMEPENFKDRIIFMFMFNDIEWKKNDENCISNAEKVKNYSKRFLPGHWTFLGPGSG